MDIHSHPRTNGSNVASDSHIIGSSKFNGKGSDMETANSIIGFFNEKHKESPFFYIYNAKNKQRFSYTNVTNKVKNSTFLISSTVYVF